jgi:membrane protease YdiL (CAAX protease family)
MSISSIDRPAVSTAGGVRGLLQRHPLLSYFVMAYGFSWLGWLPYVLGKDGLGLLPWQLGQVGLIPGAYLGPLLSGFLMVGATEGKAGARHLWRRMVQWREGWQWYVVALVGIPVISMLGFLAIPDALAAFHPVFPQVILFLLLLLPIEILTSGLAEEPGWRGFALPRLQERYGPLLASIILGVLWQCWHLPLYLTDWGRDAGWLGISLDIIGNLGLTILITWVFNHTRGSLLIAILLHAMLDTFASTSALSIFSFAWVQQHGHLAMLIGFNVVGLILVIATRGRLGYKQASPPTPTDVTVVLNRDRY